MATALERGGEVHLNTVRLDGAGSGVAVLGLELY